MKAGRGATRVQIELPSGEHVDLEVAAYAHALGIWGDIARCGDCGAEWPRVEVLSKEACPECGALRVGR